MTARRTWREVAAQRFIELLCTARTKRSGLAGVRTNDKLGLRAERNRMKLDDLHIGVSPLTDTIYLGTLSKRDRGAWARKVDCTSNFIGALMDWTPPGTVRLVKDNHGNRYEIEVRKMPPEQA